MKKSLLVLLAMALMASSASAKVNVFGLYNTANQMNIKNMDYTSLGHGKSNFVINTDAGFAFGVEFQDALSEQIGFGVSLAYGLPVNLKHVKVTNQSGTVISDADYTGTLPTISTIVLAGNLYYQFNSQLYLLGGLNLNIPTYTRNTNGSDKSIGGKLGIQFGAGYNVTEKISLEGIYQILNVSVHDNVNNKGAENGDSAGLNLRAKYTLF